MREREREKRERERERERAFQLGFSLKRVHLNFYFNCIFSSLLKS